jgi:hypothetical protein
VFDLDWWIIAFGSIPLSILAGVILLALRFRLRRRLVLYVALLLGLAAGGVYVCAVGTILLRIFLQDITGNEMRWVMDAFPFALLFGALAGIGWALLIARRAEPAAFRPDPTHSADYSDEVGARTNSSGKR